MSGQKMRSTNIQTSISSVIGNATSFYIEWIKSKFPEDFFKDTYVSGTLVSVETQRKDIYKKSKPMLLVKPQYAAENGFIETMPYWHSTLQYVYNNPDRYYTPVFDDKEKKIRIHAIPDRIKINFPTMIIVPTQVYGFNLLHYMKNIIEPGGHGFINNVFFENELPSVYMHYLFDLIYNKDARERNIAVNREIAEMEQQLYNLEGKIISNLRVISKINKVEHMTSVQSNKLMELNLANIQLNKETKKLKQDIDKRKRDIEPMRSLADPDEEAREINRKDLETYINKFSNGAIRCRRNASSGTYEYVFKNKCNILMHMDSLPSMDVTKVGRTEDYATISFEVSFDFNINSNFIFESQYEPLTTNIPPEELKDKRYHFNIWFEENVPEYELDGLDYFIMRNKQKFICEFNSGVETLEFGDMLDDACKMLHYRLMKAKKQLIDKHGGNTDEVKSIMNTHIKKLFRVKTFVNGTNPVNRTKDEHDTSENHFHWKTKELEEGKNFTVDWDNLKINMLGPIKDASYLLAIYVNYAKVNEIVKEIDEYNATKLHNTKDICILRSPGGFKFQLIVDGDINLLDLLGNRLLDMNGIPMDGYDEIVPDLMLLERSAKKYQAMSVVNTIYDIRVTDKGVLEVVPSLLTKEESNFITINGYELYVDEDGNLMCRDLT